MVYNHYLLIDISGHSSNECIYYSIFCSVIHPLLNWENNLSQIELPFDVNNETKLVAKKKDYSDLLNILLFSFKLKIIY